MDKIQLQRMEQIAQAEAVCRTARPYVNFYPVTTAYGKEMVLWDIYDEEEFPMWDSFGVPGGCFVHKGKYHASYVPLLHNDKRKVHPHLLK